MDKLKDLRKQIDELDTEIMEKIAARLKLMPQIYQAKSQLQLPLTDEAREQAVLAKTEFFPYPQEISAIYAEIIRQSKARQFATGLVGKSLSYSYSPLIHKAFGNSNYQLFETADLENFLKTNAHIGLNITNPFKVQASKLAHNLSPIAQKTQITNVLSWESGQRQGDNVDYQAFWEMLDYFQIDCSNEKVLILGNGATAQTVFWAVKDRGAKTVQKLGRTLHEETDDYLANIANYQDYTIIVNTIPYGVHPQLESTYLVSFDQFTSPKAFIDVNYNPHRSAFMQEGRKLQRTFPQLKLAYGLYMLVSGGRLTEEIWQKQKITSPKTIDVVKTVYLQHVNIVLIGLPYSGKTILGKALAYTLGKTFFDSDEILESRKQSIHDLPSLEEFRAQEKAVIKELAKKQNSVIATGGGVVENEENMLLLSQNSIIIWLNLPFEWLIPRIDETRPLSHTIDKLKALAQNRERLYREFADIIIDNPHNILQETGEKLNEYLNHQWPES